MLDENRNFSQRIANIPARDGEDMGSGSKVVEAEIG
jgi:hypothetical protein